MIRVRLNGRLLDDIQEVSSLGLVDPRPGQLLWVHCEAADDPELNAIAARFHVHPLAIEDLRNSNQRPKLDDYGNSCSRPTAARPPPPRPDGTGGTVRAERPSRHAPLRP